MPPIPVKIKLASPDGTLAIQWSDGHASSYPYSYLRRKCPCANCEETPPQPEQSMGGLPIIGQRPLHPERAELVGRYALQIHWSDHHSAGIYSFEYLRSICPCPECTARRELTD